MKFNSLNLSDDNILVIIKSRKQSKLVDERKCGMYDVLCYNGFGLSVFKRLL